MESNIVQFIIVDPRLIMKPLLLKCALHDGSLSSYHFGNKNLFGWLGSCGKDSDDETPKQLAAESRNQKQPET